MLKLVGTIGLTLAIGLALNGSAMAGGTGQFNDRHVIGGMKGAKVYCGKGLCRSLSRTTQARYAK